MLSHRFHVRAMCVLQGDDISDSLSEQPRTSPYATAEQLRWFGDEKLLQQRAHAEQDQVAATIKVDNTDVHGGRIPKVAHQADISQPQGLSVSLEISDCSGMNGTDTALSLIIDTAKCSEHQE